MEQYKNIVLCMDNINDLQIGKAGEYLVCADLIMNGYIAYPSEQGLSYDVVLDVDGRLLKLQVKTTRKPRKIPYRKNHTKKYSFHVKRCGKGGKKHYTVNDVDIFALVALDEKDIGYIKANAIKQTMFFLPKDTLPVKDASSKKNKIIELRKKGLSYGEIGKELLVDPGYAHRVVLGKENKYFSKSYLSDYKIQKCLY